LKQIGMNLQIAGYECEAPYYCNLARQSSGLWYSGTGPDTAPGKLDDWENCPTHVNEGIDKFTQFIGFRYQWEAGTYTFKAEGVGKIHISAPGVNVNFEFDDTIDNSVKTFNVPQWGNTYDEVGTLDILRSDIRTKESSTLTI
jgi:hypothetical protein